jgi:hypothetical protein
MSRRWLTSPRSMACTNKEFSENRARRSTRLRLCNVPNRTRRVHDLSIINTQYEDLKRKEKYDECSIILGKIWFS